MIKKQQKWIALLVTLTFVWLLQVSTMPLAAASTTEQIGSANAEQSPRFIEEEGDGGYQAKKKSIMPIILIGVGVVAVAAVLFLVVLKTKYDITGEWKYSWKNTGDTNWKYANQAIVFTGDKKTGTLAYLGYTGTYAVDGKNVSIQFVYGTNSSVTNTGVFSSKDKISGTWKVDQNTTTTGDWEAVRAGTTAQAAAPLTQGDVPGTKSKK
jgi:hypothetical protein